MRIKSNLKLFLLISSIGLYTVNSFATDSNPTDNTAASPSTSTSISTSTSTSISTSISTSASCTSKSVLDRFSKVDYDIVKSYRSKINSETNHLTEIEETKLSLQAFGEYLDKYFANDKRTRLFKDTLSILEKENRMNVLNAILVPMLHAFAISESISYDEASYLTTASMLVQKDFKGDYKDLRHNWKKILENIKVNKYKTKQATTMDTITKNGWIFYPIFNAAELEISELSEAFLNNVFPIAYTGNQKTTMHGIDMSPGGLAYHDFIHGYLRTVLLINLKTNTIYHFMLDDMIEEFKAIQQKIDDMIEESKARLQKIDDMIEESKARLQKIDDMMEGMQTTQPKTASSLSEPKDTIYSNKALETIQQAMNILGSACSNTNEKLETTYFTIIHEIHADYLTNTLMKFRELKKNFGDKCNITTNHENMLLDKSNTLIETIASTALEYINNMTEKFISSSDDDNKIKEYIYDEVIEKHPRFAELRESNLYSQGKNCIISNIKITNKNKYRIDFTINDVIISDYDDFDGFVATKLFYELNNKDYIKLLEKAGYGNVNYNMSIFELKYHLGKLINEWKDEIIKIKNYDPSI